MDTNVINNKTKFMHIHLNIKIQLQASKILYNSWLDIGPDIDFKDLVEVGPISPVITNKEAGCIYSMLLMHCQLGKSSLSLRPRRHTGFCYSAK